jgi:hypothetical protein
MEVEGAGHELLPKKSSTDLPGRIADAFQAFIGPRRSA